MRVLMDACIIYPTVMREMLMETAALGGFTPRYGPTKFLKNGATPQAAPTLKSAE